MYVNWYFPYFANKHGITGNPTLFVNFISQLFFNLAVVHFVFFTLEPVSKIMNFEQSVKYLYGLGNEVLAMKLGLENIGVLLDALGQPQKAIQSLEMASAIYRQFGHRRGMARALSSIAAVKLLSGSQLLNPNAWTTKLTGWLVDGLATILPDLGRFTQTGWLVNGPEAMSVLGFVVLQTCVYGLLLVLAGLYDLYRKNL